MILAILQESAERGELILMKDGLCRWHKRRDGVVVVREILVQPWCHHQGIGRKMIREIQMKNPGASLMARCPNHFSSNQFWHALGFVCERQLPKINEWWLRPGSSSAPTATPRTLALPMIAAGSTAPDSRPEASPMDCSSTSPIKTGNGQTEGDTCAN